MDLGSLFLVAISCFRKARTLYILTQLWTGQYYFKNAHGSVKIGQKEWLSRRPEPYHHQQHHQVVRSQRCLVNDPFCCMPSA